MHLDTVCTMVDVDAIVMYPNVAHTLSAHAVTCRETGAGRRQADLSSHPRSRSSSRPRRRWASTRFARSTPGWTR